MDKAITDGTFCDKDARRLEDSLMGKIQVVKAELEGKIEPLKTLVTENDKRYAEKFKSQDEGVDKAFTSAQTAIDKSEANQTKINDGTYVKLTDITGLLAAKMGTVDYQTAQKQVIESIIRFDLTLKDKVDTSIYNINNLNLQKQIDELKLSQSGTKERGVGATEGWVKAWALVSSVISVILFLVTILKVFG